MTRVEVSNTEREPRPAWHGTKKNRLARIERPACGPDACACAGPTVAAACAFAYPAAWIASSYTPATRRAITALSKLSRA